MLTKLIYVLIGIFAVYSQAPAKRRRSRPPMTRPGSCFVMPPMPKATRTVVIPLGDIQFAFDTEKLRPHTVWRGKLDLYGPQYAHAKRPFISQPNGKLLFENPPSLPWRLAKPEPKFDTTSPGIEGRFLSTSTEGNTVTLRYELLQNDHPPVDVSITLEATADGFTRTIDLSPLQSVSLVFGQPISRRERSRFSTQHGRPIHFLPYNPFPTRLHGTEHHGGR